MDIFSDYKMDKNSDGNDNSVPGHRDRNNGIDKISRYDRYVDTSFELSIEDTGKIKVDRVDRM